MNDYTTRASFAECVREDALVWSRMWNRPLSVAVFLRLLLLEPGFQLAFSIRLQRAVDRVPLVGRFLRRILWYGITIWTGSDIDPDADVGPGVYFPHPTAIVIGGSCRLGRNVSILQGVTLGRVVSTDPRGPQLGNNVVVNAGAKLLGGIEIGDDAIVGANAVVLKDVLAGHVAVGVPAKSRPRSPTKIKPE